jgi:hypothetical protein
VNIDIDKLNEAELVDLNHRVVERLRFLQQARAHVAMLQFRIGDQVEFDADARGGVRGTLVRYNKKTVSVLTSDGHRWTVSPALLRPARDERPSQAADQPGSAILPPPKDIEP